MRRAIITLLALASLTLAGVSSVSAKTEHCPDGGTKFENGDFNDIVLVLGTPFCVKGSTDATGILVADGETSLVDYLDNGHDVSYYIVYDVIIQPSPTPEQSVEPSVQPSVEPSVEPSVQPTPSPTSSIDVPAVVTPTPRPSAPGEVPDTGIAAEELDDAAGATIFTLLGGTLVGLAVLYLLSNKPLNGKK